MPISPVYTTSKAQRKDNVKKGAYQLAGGPFFVRFILQEEHQPARLPKKAKVASNV